MKGKTRNNIPTSISLLSCRGGTKQATRKQTSIPVLVYWRSGAMINWHYYESNCMFTSIMCHLIKILRAFKKLQVESRQLTGNLLCYCSCLLKTRAFKRQKLSKHLDSMSKAEEGFGWSEEQFSTLLPGVQRCSVCRACRSPGPAARWPHCENPPGTPPGECFLPASHSTAQPGQAATRR